MVNVLDKICAGKHQHIAACQAAKPLVTVQKAAYAAPAPRGFYNALKTRARSGRMALIAEIKKASPSKGLIRADFNPAALAEAYRQGGASCLSVLTDIPYFQGDDAYLEQARRAVPLPALRKDFMLDPYQIYESRALGADCILLILAALTDTQATELESLAHDLGMDVLAEVHDDAELERALRLKTPLIGINNRNLKTLEVSLEVGKALAAKVPDDRFLVAESGLYSFEDLHEMRRHGAAAFLVGESLMRQKDVALATRRLLGEADIV